MKFYTYLWLRYDGSPYYVGKGCGARAWKWHRGFKNPPQRERVIIQHWPDEQSAFEAEKFLIALYGRIDLGTGCLRNQSDGGTGGATRRGKKFPNRRSDFGARRSKATRAKMSIAQSRVVSNRGRFTKGHPFVGRRKRMAIYRPPEDPNKGTFAGGTMSQAMHKHKLMHKGEESKDSKTTVSEHLEKAEEHIKHARAAHGQMSESKEQDPHEVNEEVGGGGMSEVMSGE